MQGILRATLKLTPYSRHGLRLILHCLQMAVTLIPLVMLTMLVLLVTQVLLIPLVMLITLARLPPLRTPVMLIPLILLIPLVADGQQEYRDIQTMPAISPLSLGGILAEHRPMYQHSLMMCHIWLAVI